MSIIEIRPPASIAEYQQACSLVEEVYYEHGISSERKLRHPKAIFVAVREGEVLGSVGLKSAESGPLPIEHYFGFSFEQLCAPSRAAVCEIVKLAASKHADGVVYKGLVAACAHYLFVQRSFELAVAILKPRLEENLRTMLRIPTHRLPFQVVPERARADYPRYFFEGATPVPIFFHPADHALYLGRLLADIADKAVLRCQDFDHSRDYSGATA